MPALDHKLASQRIRHQGGNRGLNSVLFDTSAAARVRAPQIDPNAANVQFTPVQPGQVGIKTPLEATAEGASKLMEVWGNAATQYADRQHELDANLALQQIQENHQRTLYGDETNPGYLQSALEDSRKRFKPTLDTLDQHDQEILKSLAPGARVKAVSQYYTLREQTRRKAIEHRHAQDTELEKRMYLAGADSRSHQLAQELITNFADFPDMTFEDQKAFYEPIFGAIQQENDRRASKMQYAPPGTNFSSSTIEDVMRNLLTSADPKALPLAEALWPHLEKSMDDPTGREKVYKLMLETYSKKNLRAKVDLETKDLRLQVQSEEARRGVQEEVIARLNDPVALARFKRMHLGNKYIMGIIDDTVASFSGDLAFDPKREQAVLEVMYQDLDPITAVNIMREKYGFQVTKSDFEKFSSNYNSKLGETQKKYTALIYEQLEGMLKDKAKIEESVGQELAMVLEDTKDTPPGQELLARLKRQVSSFITQHARDVGGKVDITTFEKDVETYISDTIFNSAVTSLTALRDSKATASIIPEQLQLGRLANNETNVPRLDQSKTVIEGLWQLRYYMYDVYANDTKYLQELKPLLGSGVTFENLQDTYEIAIAENNTTLLNQLNALFRSLYVDTQKYMFDKHGVKATDRVNYERDTKRAADQYTQRYLEDQQAAPEGAK